jgi:hypothetical protein
MVVTGESCVTLPFSPRRSIVGFEQAAWSHRIPSPRAASSNRIDSRNRFDGILRPDVREINGMLRTVTARYRRMSRSATMTWVVTRVGSRWVSRRTTRAVWNLQATIRVVAIRSRVWPRQGAGRSPMNIGEIARRSGASRSTVSYALSGKRTVGRSRWRGTCHDLRRGHAERCPGAAWPC